MKIKFGFRGTFKSEPTDKELLIIADAWMICDNKIEKEEHEEGYFDELIKCMMKKLGYSREKIVNLMKYIRPIEDIEVTVR